MLNYSESDIIEDSSETKGKNWLFYFIKNSEQF